MTKDFINTKQKRQRYVYDDATVCSDDTITTGTRPISMTTVVKGNQRVLGLSPMKIPIQQEELIEMTEPTESFTFTESQQNSMASLFAGVGSGALSSIACAPLDLVRTRMQVIKGL